MLLNSARIALGCIIPSLPALVLDGAPASLYMVIDDRNRGVRSIQAGCVYRKSAALEWAHAMILALRSLIFFMIVALAPIAGAELVRTVIPRSTLNYLSIPVAEVKGYFRDQGLENQAIVIPGSTAARRRCGRGRRCCGTCSATRRRACWTVTPAAATSTRSGSPVSRRSPHDCGITAGPPRRWC